ncbi:hypothetical protein MU1_23750 [Paenibacillus glycanilyticus]|uniref:DUF6199 domain-containing protein n=1 Tax=Paenibacillus glycanilyticus TaxID=126569 RepID=A0ABQ6GCN3_9BACL|nr:hypothetical protein MU1_23750 [Paenibacillus glycanilyticus]
MIAEMICILWGLLFVVFPRRIWYVSQFMIRIKEGKLVFESEPANSFAVWVNRIMGGFLVIVGLFLLFSGER